MVIPDDTPGLVGAKLGALIGAGFEVNLEGLDDFAKKLEREVLENYVPQMERFQRDLMATLPPVNQFQELLDFVRTHDETKQNMSDHMHNMALASGGFATAAKKVGGHYRGSDELAQARADEVNRALDQTQAVAPPTPDPNTGAHTQSGTGGPAGPTTVGQPQPSASPTTTSQAEM